MVLCLFSQNPFTRSFFYRGVIPLMILYCGIKHFWRCYQLCACFKKDLASLKDMGRITYDEDLLDDLPIKLCPVLPKIYAITDSLDPYPITLLSRVPTEYNVEIKYAYWFCLRSEIVFVALKYIFAHISPESTKQGFYEHCSINHRLLCNNFWLL